MTGGRTVWSHMGSDRRADSKPGNAELLRPKAERSRRNGTGRGPVRERGTTFSPRVRDEDRVVAHVWSRMVLRLGRLGGRSLRGKGQTGQVPLKRACPGPGGLGPSPGLSALGPQREGRAGVSWGLPMCLGLPCGLVTSFSLFFGALILNGPHQSFLVLF